MASHSFHPLHRHQVDLDHVSDFLVERYVALVPNISAEHQFRVLDLNSNNPFIPPIELWHLSSPVLVEPVIHPYEHARYSFYCTHAMICVLRYSFWKLLQAQMVYNENMWSRLLGRREGWLEGRNWINLVVTLSSGCNYKTHLVLAMIPSASRPSWYAYFVQHDRWATTLSIFWPPLGRLSPWVYQIKGRRNHNPYDTL